MHNICEGGNYSNGLIVPARRPFVPWMGMAVSEARTALADGDDYRMMAERLCGLARLTRSPGIRRELVDLAKRYDRRGDHFDRRPPEGGLFEEVSLSPSPAMMGRHDPSAASL